MSLVIPARALALGMALHLHLNQCENKRHAPLPSWQEATSVSLQETSVSGQKRNSSFLLQSTSWTCQFHPPVPPRLDWHIRVKPVRHRHLKGNSCLEPKPCRLYFRSRSDRYRTCVAWNLGLWPRPTLLIRWICDPMHVCHDGNLVTTCTCRNIIWNTSVHEFDSRPTVSFQMTMTYWLYPYLPI